MISIQKAKADIEKLRASSAELIARIDKINADIEKLEIFIEVAERYEAGDEFNSRASKKRSSGPSQKDMIESASREALREKQAPLPTIDLIEILESQGIKITGKDKKGSLASILSRSDDFDNVRGVGWHLKEWGAKDDSDGNQSGCANEDNDESPVKDDGPQPQEASGPVGNGHGSNHDAFGFGSNPG